MAPLDASTPRANPSNRQVQNQFALDKVNTYWSEGLDKETQKLLGDRFGLEGVKDVISLEEKSLLDVVNEVTEIVQGASLLLIQSDSNVKVKWMYELASDASHCGFDSIRLSVFKWSDTKDMDVYERKLFNVKGKDLEGAICASTICRDGLACECLLPHGSGKLRAGVQAEMSVSVTMQPGGYVETTPVQNDANCPRTDHQGDGSLQLVTDENAVFGNITKFLSVEMYAGGHVYALASFKSDAGEMNRLMRKHPMMGAWFVHSGLTSEASDSASLSADRQQGCIVSEEGSRVALFRIQNSSVDEQPASSLLTEAQVHRPALQLLSHHTR
ncbi:Abnormal embryogenesis protein 30 [Trichostrongylus colubriformis]|uniref:Abnormal embryogenesis protein 30 n=1 Tax=Trichostrongylus colubriformis TaxID=6319 RepID=A0AAN8FT53_TRICO